MGLGPAALLIQSDNPLKRNPDYGQRQAAGTLAGDGAPEGVPHRASIQPLSDHGTTMRVTLRLREIAEEPKR